MKTQTQFNKFAVASLLVLSLGTVAFADGGTAPAAGHGKWHRHHRRALFKACANANGISLPAKGSGQKLSQADFQTVIACVQKNAAEFRQDVKACLQNDGVSRPEPGQQLTASEKAALKTCSSQAVSEIFGSSNGSSSNSTGSGSN